MYLISNHVSMLKADFLSQWQSSSIFILGAGLKDPVLLLS